MTNDRGPGRLVTPESAAEMIEASMVRVTDNGVLSLLNERTRYQAPDLKQTTEHLVKVFAPGQWKSIEPAAA